MRAVDGVSLELRHGDRLAVIGESGSGKSTLLRLILGVEAPDTGTVSFDGRAIHAGSDLKWLRRRMQFVPQDPSTTLNPRMTVLQAVCEPLRCLRIDVDHRQRAYECLDVVGLSAAHAKRRPAQLSGGQRQRVAIARALSVDPDVIVADEAVSDLDASVRQTVLDGLLKGCAEMNLALLLVTHDLGVAYYTCDSIVVLDKGRVVDAGETRSVLRAPQSAITSRLVAAVPRLPHAHTPASTLLATEQTAPTNHPTNTPTRSTSKEPT
ncbi:MAG: ABC transporter ATP-binding protein [Actinomycetales bacterium]|nr:MAG: ABC transporter ATP-binding protein [Actinomycetales bacterium]